MNIDFNFIEVVEPDNYTWVDAFSISTRKINKTKSDEVAKRLGRIHNIKSISISIQDLFELILKSDKDHGFKSIIVSHYKKSKESDIL